MSIVSAAAGDVTRSWRLPNATLITLRHNTIVGTWNLSIDAIEEVEGRATLMSGKVLLGLPAKSGAKGYIIIEPRVTSGAFAYTLWAGDPAQQIASEQEGGPCVPDTSGGFTVAVVGYDVVIEREGGQVVWYRITVRRGSDGASTVVHRRHREFYALGETVLSSYKGTMLEKACPPLPSRTVPFMQNAMDPMFLEGRRAELHNQLVKLEAVPRVRTNPDFLAFVGLLDNTRESSVIFGPGQAMGLSLKNAGATTEVETVKEGPAQASGTVAIGSQVSKVQGEDVLGQSYDTVIAKLKASPRPMVVHFLTTLGGPSASTQGLASFVGQAGVTTAASSVTATGAAQVEAPGGLVDVI